MTALLVVASLLALSVLVPLPAADAVCSPTLDLARACVTVGATGACASVHFGGETQTRCTPPLP